MARTASAAVSTRRIRLPRPAHRHPAATRFPNFVRGEAALGADDQGDGADPSHPGEDPLQGERPFAFVEDDFPFVPRRAAQRLGVRDDPGHLRDAAGAALLRGGQRHPLPSRQPFPGIGRVEAGDRAGRPERDHPRDAQLRRLFEDEVHLVGFRESHEQGDGDVGRRFRRERLEDLGPQGARRGLEDPHPVPVPLLVEGEEGVAHGEAQGAEHVPRLGPGEDGGVAGDVLSIDEEGRHRVSPIRLPGGGGGPSIARRRLRREGRRRFSRTPRPPSRSSPKGCRRE